MSLDTPVIVQMRCERPDQIDPGEVMEAGWYGWHHNNRGGDIIAYQIIRGEAGK